jgi:hypothetical protein
MSTSQDPSQKFHQYDSDDRQLLVGLLHEYSDKLVEASREVARKRARAMAITGEIFVILPALALSYSFSYLFWILLLSYLKTDDLNGFSANFYHAASMILIEAVICCTLILFPVVLFFLKKSNLFTFLYFRSTDRLQKIETDLLEKDARMIANRLESAMRLTVEIADRVETNLARKLELDLRIDDAASALEYYYSVVNLKPKVKPKSQKSIWAYIREALLADD